MRKTEIDRKFNEIVGFSGVERFLDTPVKRYSSGMYVRLAFAVAAHLEPEILLVDEVLAVGDAAFQKRCLGKMGDAAQEGRTVLLVSHNMAAVEHLCSQGIMLSHGTIHCSGDMHSIVAGYERHLREAESPRAGLLPAHNREYGLTVKSVTVSLEPCPSPRHKLLVQACLSVRRPTTHIGVGVSMSTTRGVLISKLSPSITGFVLGDIGMGEVACQLTVEDINEYLAGGDYVLDFWLSKPRVEYIIYLENVATFSIPRYDRYGTGKYFDSMSHGLVPLRAKFRLVEQ
jgi:lipopolysaccharide transport system ATP-binding protein